jgi:hypothetical protein
VSEVQARLAELERLGLTRRLRLISGPQTVRMVIATWAAASSKTTSAPLTWTRTRGPTRRCAGVFASVGHDDDPRPPRGAPGDFKASEARSVRLGYLANLGAIGALAGRGGRISLRRAQPRLDRRCVPVTAEVVVYRHRDPSTRSHACSDTWRGGRDT